MQGVYILITSDGCRVAPLNSYDSLFEGFSPDMKKYINREALRESFGFCIPMTEAEAIETAKVIARGYREMPDGIRILTDYRNYSFGDLLNGSHSKN